MWVCQCFDRYGYRSLIEFISLWKSPSINAGRVFARASERASVWTIVSSPYLGPSLPPGYHRSGCGVRGDLQAVQGPRVLAAHFARQRLRQMLDQLLLGIGGVDAREVARV